MRISIDSPSGGDAYDYRELHIGNDFVYRESPDITYFQLVYTSNSHYHEFRIYSRIEFFDTVKDVKITGNVLYNGEVVDSFVFEPQDDSTSIIRDYNIYKQTSGLPEDALQEQFSITFTKIEANVKLD